MKHATFQEEKKLWRKGFNNIVGIDEAGRGSLAGPVVAVAVSLRKNCSFEKLKIKRELLRDSKKLSFIQREKIFEKLKSNKFLRWGIGIVSFKTIDKINIFEATKLAMKKSLDSLLKKHKDLKIDYIILDGNFKLDTNLKQKSIIKADEKVASCAIASIFAKVKRDRIMIEFQKKYPLYSFAKHKGYGTKLHFLEIEKYGASEIHRKTFYPFNN
jgi:ribonuclease HII